MIISTIVVIFVTIFMKTGNGCMLGKCNGMLIWIVLWLHILASIQFGLFMSSFFTRSKSLIIFTNIMHFVYVTPFCGQRSTKMYYCPLTCKSFDKKSSRETCQFEK
jgi:hypothetical protein